MSEYLENALMLGIGFVLGWIFRFGIRRDISEARFDSKTGKQIK